MWSRNDSLTSGMYGTPVPGVQADLPRGRVDDGVVGATEQDEVVEARLASACPVLDVVSIHEALPLAPGEAAAVVSPPQGAP